MTTIITRLYENEKTAKSVVKKLHDAGFPDNLVDMISKSSNAQSEMAHAHLSAQAADAYGKAMKDGNVLVVVRAPFTPFGAAARAMMIVDDAPSIDASVENENEYIKQEVSTEYSKSVMTDHPLFFTRPRHPDAPRSSTVTGALGFRLLSKDTRRNSAIAGGRHMSRAFWPMPLLKSKRRKTSAISGGRFMSKAFWPTPLLSTKPRSLSVRPGGGTPFSEIFGLRLLSRR
ncbi:MAG: hypothetical protein AAF415_13875 [Pseudomonadota bacterium]